MTEINEDGAWAKDRMQRKEVAAFLSSYLDKNERIRVLNINAPWGAGKTFFLNNWMKENEDGRACVYFNAWENDFSGDAFVSLVAVIRDQLEDIVGTALKADRLVKSFTENAAKAILAATPVLAKGLIKKISGADVDEIVGAIEIDDLADATEKAAEKAVENLITSNKETLKIVGNFKKVFRELLAAAAEKRKTDNTPKPVYIFIDELDRCRPTFSIELLERLKHLFDAPNCKFIIATDTPQLVESIKAVYGTGFNSFKYLKRFFDAEFTLDNSSYDAWVKVNFVLGNVPPLANMGLFTNANQLGSRFANELFTYSPPDADTALAGPANLNQPEIVFLAIVKAFNLQLRDLESIVFKLGALQASVRTKEFDLFWACYLMVLKDDAPDLYEMAIRGDVSEAIQQISARYRSRRNFNFRTGNANMLTIFETYVTLYRGGQQTAYSRIRELQGDTPPYVEKAAVSFSNEFEAMAEYPKLVELSHRLKV